MVWGEGGGSVPRPLSFWNVLSGPAGSWEERLRSWTRFLFHQICTTLEKKMPANIILTKKSESSRNFKLCRNKSKKICGLHLNRILSCREFVRLHLSSCLHHINRGGITWRNNSHLLKAFTPATYCRDKAFERVDLFFVQRFSSNLFRPILTEPNLT